MGLDPADELSRCVVDLLLREPFFGHLLSGVVRRVTDATPTASVSLVGGRVVLSANPTFFVETLRSKYERTAVVKHETLHLLFKHLYRMDLDRHDRLLFNIAADLVVNQFIKRPWRLPKSAVTLKTFPDAGLEPDQSVEWYYEKLQDVDEDSAPKSAGALEKIRGTDGWHSDHDQWGRAGSDAEREAAESDLDRMIVQARDRAGPRAWGKLPGPLQDLIDAIIEKRRPKLDWRRVIRMFSASSRKTRVTDTLRRPSKRYGTYPGIKVKRYQRVAVGLDTSGSVSDDDLSEFFAEIRGIWRQGAEVTIVECDAAVQRTWTYRGQIPTGVAGRGGTVFDPVFQWMRENRMKPWDACIYLTDGHAAAPEVRPPCPVLWVVTPNGQVGDHLRYGRAVKLPVR